MSRYTREIHTRELRRALFWENVWGAIASFFFRRQHAAERRIIDAAKKLYGGVNPAYKCNCGDCWHALAEDLAQGRVKP